MKRLIEFFKIQPSNWPHPCRKGLFSGLFCQNVCSSFLSVRWQHHLDSLEKPQQKQSGKRFCPQFSKIFRENRWKPIWIVFHRISEENLQVYEAFNSIYTLWFGKMSSLNQKTMGRRPFAKWHTLRSIGTKNPRILSLNLSTRTFVNFRRS